MRVHVLAHAHTYAHVIVHLLTHAHTDFVCAHAQQLRTHAHTRIHAHMCERAGLAGSRPATLACGARRARCSSRCSRRCRRQAGSTGRRRIRTLRRSPASRVGAAARHTKHNTCTQTHKHAHVHTHVHTPTSTHAHNTRTHACVC